MRALVNIEAAPYRVELQEKRTPEPGPDDVLLRVRGVGVCGSDLHQWHNTHA
jgi:alcohol dehydrogenase/L-iditol 2-dehydrogenase